MQWLANTPAAPRQGVARDEATPLQPVLDRVLRRCPLLPSEVARLEQVLGALLGTATPEQIAQRCVEQLTRRSPTQREQVHRHLHDALRSTTTSAAASAAWQQECRRVVRAVLDGVHRIYGTRLAGTALYAVTNRCLGRSGTQALNWAQHTWHAGALLAQPAWLPWMDWLMQLPLPSLREGGWLEPLMATLPDAVHEACVQLRDAHDDLHAWLAAVETPTRMLLLTTAWVLWARLHREAVPSPPRTPVGRSLGQLPQVLQRLDRCSRGLRRVFAPPATSTASATQGTASVIAALTAATGAVLCGPRQHGSTGTISAATAIAALGLGIPSRVAAEAVNTADASQRVALIDTLWSLRDAMAGNATLELGERPVEVVPQSLFAQQLSQVRAHLAQLYRQDDFLAALYRADVPPRSLHLRDAVLSGRQLSNETVIQVHPPSGQRVGLPWSATTAALLRQLQTAVEQAGRCYHVAGPPLQCALQFHLNEALPATGISAAALSGWIQQLEQSLPDDAHLTATGDANTLRRLRADMVWAKAQPVRGLAPPWPRWRPDPRSHLGYNLALTRRTLQQLSAHPALLQLCGASDADPHALTFPAHGSVMAARPRGQPPQVLFHSADPPVALASLAAALRGLAAVLQAPLRSNGQLRVPEMLAFYGIPWPGVALGDAPFDVALAALDARLASTVVRPAAPVPRPPADAPPPQPALQDLVDALWHLLDARNGAEDTVDLASTPFAAPHDPILRQRWDHAQHLLLTQFEDPELWQPMQRANATFDSLCVSADHISVADPAGRRIRLDLTGSTPPSSTLHQLHHRAGRFGRLVPEAQPSLADALSFHGVSLRPPGQACHLPVPMQRWQLLPLLAQLHRDDAATSAYLRALGDLHDILRQPARMDTTEADVYRPSLGAAAARVYAALGDLAALLAHPAVNLTVPGLRDRFAHASVSADGLLSGQMLDEARFSLNASRAWAQVPELASRLDALRAHASAVGASVRTDGRVHAEQVLAMHGSCEPRVPGQPQALMDCAERILGELRLGMRPHLLHAADVLDAMEVEVLRDSVAAYLSAHARAGISLLEYLGTPLVERGVFAWHEVHRLRPALAEMARSPRALRLHTALLDALGWHGAALNATTSPTLLGSLTVQAVLTDLGPASVRAQRIVLGYRMHKHANHGRTFAAIREDFTTYLGSLGRLPAPLLPMAVALALQEEAPELAAADIPAPLVFGSAIASVDYTSGVHLAERIQRGLSAQMNFSTLLSLWGEAADDPQLPTQARQMVVDARQLPLFDWWTFRDLGGNQSCAYAPSAASAMFDARVRRIDAAISHLLAPLPYRMPMVEAELTRVFPVFPGVFAGLQWNASTLRLCRDAHSFPLFELYAAGALLSAPQDWHPCRHFVPDTPMSRAQGHTQHSWQRDQTDAALQRGFARLANITADFQRVFDAYFQRATDGYGVLVEEALYLRPEDEQHAITRGEVEIFTLRTHTELEAGQETRNDTDHLRGRFGVIYALGVDGRRRYFQLFPLHSRILPLALEGELPVGGVLEPRSVRLRHGRHATIQVRRGTPLPLDWDAYASYQPPVTGRTSTVIVERLPVQSDIAAEDGMTRSPFHALVAPLQRDFFWLDRVAFLHEARAPTSFEAHLKSPPLWLQAVEFVVPFVANLRKITSADRDEFALAAFGLYLEGVLITWPISGSVFKVLARPGARLTLPRVNELATVVGKGMLDALNPAAGVIAATRLGVSVVQHGVGGGVRFIWSRLQGSPLRAAQRGLHLFDPATLTPYGPALRQGSDSGSAAGVLFKVGEGLRVKPSVGKALKPIKQGSKASQEDSREALGIPSPPRLEMPARAGTP